MTVSREQFETWVQEAIDSVPPDIAELIDNVAFVVEEEPPPGENLLGLYRGIPHPSRTSSYGGVLPDVITIYRGPLQRYYGASDEVLHTQIKRTVLHEIAHHFGISDERLVGIDRY